MTKTDQDLDRLIAEALDAEDRQLLKDFGEEPGYFAQAFGVFRGKLAWVMWVAYIVNIVGAGIAIWAGWQMIQAEDAVAAIRWGVLVLAALQIGLYMKGGLLVHGEVNRVLRDVKRLELQVLRTKSRDAV